MSFELKLKKITESHGRATTAKVLTEAIRERKVDPRRISLRRLAESYMGSGWAEHLTRAVRSGRVTESAEAVDTSGFQDITGQLLVNEIREKYKLVSWLGDTLTTTIPVTNGNLGEQTVPYLSDVVDMGDIVQQGMPYPQTSFKGQYIKYPSVEKIGRICSVTMEAIFSDLTGQILDSAKSVATILGLTREESILRVVYGLVNTHNWNGSVYQTYNTSGNWVNKLTGFKLTDWTSINTLEQMFVNILDPVLRKPIMVEPKDMLVMPATRYTAKNILHATEVRQTVPGFADTGLPITEVSPNPLDRTYAIMSTANAYRMMTNEAGKTPEQANDIVILGDFKKAFCWREAKPLQVVEAPANNPLDFHNDIVLAVKASYMGVAGITDPRYVVYATSEDA
jgi:hypothetical protein